MDKSEAGRPYVKYFWISLHTVSEKGISMPSPHPSHYVREIWEAKTEGKDK